MPEETEYTPVVKTPPHQLVATADNHEAATLQLLVNKLRQGKVADFREEKTNATTKPALEVKASTIRTMLLGLQIDLLDGKEPQVVKLTSAGLRIKAVTVTGELDLNDASAEQGGPLPALHFEDCWFEEKIKLKRCHLRSLSLKGCRLPELQATEAVIDGPVNLRGIRRPEEKIFHFRGEAEEGYSSDGCWVVMAGAKIDGHVNCGGARFAAPPRGSERKDKDDLEDEDTDHRKRPFVRLSRHCRCALDLRAADVRGSVVLRPEVKAVGGISFSLSRVQGSIWCNGAELMAVEEDAFSADYAEIRGSLYLRVVDITKKDEASESKQFIARGQVSLFAAKIGGNLYMNGARLEKHHKLLAPDPEDFQSLDATGATMGGNCHLSLWQTVTSPRQRYPFQAEGSIALTSAYIRNDLSLSGATGKSITLLGIQIDGECRAMAFYDEKTEGDLLRPQFNAIRFDGASIRGDLRMEGALLGNAESPSEEDGFFARGAKIGGNCKLTSFSFEKDGNASAERFVCYGQVAMQEASIGNSLDMAGAQLVFQSSLNACLDIAGTRIGGDAKLMVSAPKDSGRCFRFEACGGDVTARLTATRIGGSLYLNGARLSKRQSNLTASAETDDVQSLDATGANIGNSCFLSHWEAVAFPGPSIAFEAEGDLVLTSASIRNDLVLSGATGKAVNLASIEIDGQCRAIAQPGHGMGEPFLRPKFRSIRCDSASIRGDLLIHGVLLGDATNPSKNDGIFARGAKIGGNCSLTAVAFDVGGKRMAERFECYGRVAMQEASIGNSLVMTGALLECITPPNFACLDIAGTTIGGHAQLMTSAPEDTGTCFRCEIHGGEVAVRLTNTKIAQKLTMNGALIHSSRLAIDAANVEIGGKASLSFYRPRDNSSADSLWVFEATGQIDFTAGFIKLGLDMVDAQLQSPAKADRSSPGIPLPALSLTQARLKFALLGISPPEATDPLFIKILSGLPKGVKTSRFYAAGDVKLDHAEIDTDVDCGRGRFEGRLILDYARIGDSVKLIETEIWTGFVNRTVDTMIREYRDMRRQESYQHANRVDRVQPESELDPKDADDEFTRHERSIITELANRHATRSAIPDLSLYASRLGGSLVVERLRVLSSLGDAGSRQDSRLQYIIADLRSLETISLQDDGGNGWSKRVRLWMEGFRYTRLAPTGHPQDCPISDRGNPAMNWIARAAARGWIPSIQKRLEIWDVRRDWLNLQYFDKEDPQSSEFTPGAYEQVAKVFNEDGLYHSARKSTSEKITLETSVSREFRRKVVWKPFHWFYDYGFSQARATATFCGFLLLGALGAWVARGISWLPQEVGHVMVVATNPPETAVVVEQGNPTIHLIQVAGTYPNEVACGDRIQPLLYALDVFVPVLDLHQQTICTVPHSRQGWRAAQAVYALFGWLITPLTILSFSGVFKRHLEK